MSTRQTMKKVIYCLMAMVLVNGLGVAFAQAPKTGLLPIKIGIDNAQTGYMAMMGKSDIDGQLWVIDKINKEGGINGRRIEPFVYDNESDPTKGVMNIKKLIEVDKVLAILGTSTSGVAMPQSSIVEEAGVPTLFCAATRWVIAKPPWKPPAEPTNIRHWVFKLNVNEQVLINQIYSMLKQLGTKKFAWINQGAGFGRVGREYMELTAEKEGFIVVIKEEYGPKDVDMTTQLARIKATDFDALFIYGAEMAGCLVYKQAREMGIKKPGVTTGALVQKPMRKALGKALDG